MKSLCALALVGCVPSVSAGYDTYTNLRGPVANMVNQPAATARQETAPPVADTRSYSLAFGGSFGKSRMGIEVGTHLHEVNGASFSLPESIDGVDPTSPRYLLATTSIDVRFRWLDLRYLVAEVHLGPAGGVLVDRGLIDAQLGQGFRFGATIAGKLGPLQTFADLYETEMVFNDGAAKGVSKLAGLTVGLALR